MSTYKNLKIAADQLEALAAKLEAADKATAQFKAAAAKAEKEAKLAADKAAELVKAAEAKATEVKTASAKLPEPKVAEKAKLAAEALRKSAMLSSSESQDKFAAAVANSHEAALEQLAKLASHVRPPKVATVVVDNSTSDAPTADSMWAARVASVNSRLKL